MSAVTKIIHSFTVHLFDLDGVITPTVDLHRAAWADTFTRVFSCMHAEDYRESDYFNYLDGRPRFDAVDALLRARKLAIPFGSRTDAPGLDTICAIGNLKNEAFADILARDGIAAYPGSLAFMDSLDRVGRTMAIVSSSRNARAVLDGAKITARFRVVVDGNVAEREQLAGKPAPDTFRHAARILGTDPSDCVVYEDAESGVRAARAGGFGLVVGVDRGAGHEKLTAAGADVVVNDLEELML